MLIFDVECVALNDVGNELINNDFVEIEDVENITFPFSPFVVIWIFELDESPIIISEFSNENNNDDELSELIFL